MRPFLAIALTAAAVIAACQTPAEHAAAVRAAQDSGDRMTVGRFSAKFASA
jgi:hypothetical protein